jgi:hypothetical protein
LLVLTKYGKPVIDKYLLHMNYAMAFRGLAGDKEKTDAIFTQIKGEMRTFDLKSKDMKRFIEYGWLLKVSALDKAEPVKLNFRDGLEKTAGLKRYAPIYEMSSEIAHSSPLLIYSRREYFHASCPCQCLRIFLPPRKDFCRHLCALDQRIRKAKISPDAQDILRSAREPSRSGASEDAQDGRAE